MICFSQNAKNDKLSSPATIIEAIRVNDYMDFEHHPLAQDTSAHKGNIPYGRGWCCSIINLTLNYKENVIRYLLSRGWCNVFYRVVLLHL